MDALIGFGELSLGSRLKRISEFMMKETQTVYDYFNIDFDPYLFPVYKIISNKNGVTNTEICESIKLTQPAITQTINRLEKKGLIIAKADSLDKRKKKIYLSKNGERLLIDISPVWESIDAIIKEYTYLSSTSLIQHLNTLEKKLNEKSLSETIIKKAEMNIANRLQIINYENQYAKDFYELNIEWLKTYFYVEPYDEEVLSKPKTYIINKGGHIFFTKLDTTVVGTVALMPTNDTGVFELTKMAVSPNHRGHKIGQQLMQYCIDFAKEQGFKGLMLYSNTILENAIYIYRKYGFIEIPVEAESPYKRSNIKMELNFE